jgi:Protein of unknown function (DUF3611)
MMLGKLQNAVKPSQDSSLAKAFSRLGWTGVWLQLAFGSLPVILMAYYFLFSRSTADPGDGLPFVAYLTIVDLLILAFTTFWSYRYTRLAKKMRDPARRPTESSITGTVWTGVVASTLGMLFSMIVMLIEAANMLFYFLKAPQAGMPVIQTSGTEAVHWVSSVDMLSLMALIFMLLAEQIVMMFSLWLLFRTGAGSAEFPKTTPA